MGTLVVKKNRETKTQKFKTPKLLFNPRMTN